MDKPRIGYIGLGVMGGALARRLLREHALTVFDLSPERRAEFAQDTLWQTWMWCFPSGLRVNCV